MGQKTNNKLRIFFLDFDDIKNPLLHGGQSISTYEIGKRLVKLGHKVTVICSKFPGSKDRVQNGIAYHHIGVGTGNIRLNNIVYILSIPFITAAIKADIIFECFTAPISTLLTPLFTSIPVIAKPTSFEAKRFSKKYLFPFFLIERFGCKMYRYFLSSCKSSDVKIKIFNPNIISRIIPEGVDDKYFSIKRKKPKHILFLGRFDIHQKGLDLLLKAYKLIEDKISYPLLLAGHGPDKYALEKLIKKLHLQKKVSIVGPSYGVEKLKILSEAIYVALPSRSEGFSLFALESMAGGVPLVTYDIEGLSWIKDTARFVTGSNSIKDYATNLLNATNLKKQRNKIYEARLQARLYSWDQIAKEYEQYFIDVLSFEIIRNREIKTFPAKDYTQPKV